MGETIKVYIEFDTSDLTIAPHRELTGALKSNSKARERFEALAPSMQKNSKLPLIS
jgi:hypothetical protein